MTNFEALLSVLTRHHVGFVVVGGAAAIAHGSARRIPYLRGAPPGLPFQSDLRTLARGLNFTLATPLGDIDLLGEIPGGGTYEDLASGVIELQLFRTKRAAGRPKDLEALAELEVIEDEHD